MRGWQGPALGAFLLAAGGTAQAEAPADGIVRQLREQGYIDISVDRTWLGRIQVIALAPDGTRREIVFSPGTGEILRDYVEAEDGGSIALRLMDRPAGEPNRRAGVGRPSDDGQGARQGNGRAQGNGNGQGGGQPKGSDNDG